MRKLHFVLIILSHSFLLIKAHAQDVAASTTQATSSSTSKAATCRSGADYFQQTLSNMANDPEDKRSFAILLRKEKVHLQIKPQCVESALSQVSAPSSNFIRCSGNKKGVFRRQLEPCASAEYKKAVHMSFEWVTSCLRDYVAGSSDSAAQRVWVENYFRMLTKESGLHVNVISQYNALGAAQLTSDYIEDFAKTTLPEIQQHLANSPTPACRRLAAEYLNSEKISKLYDTCAQTDINQGQPVLNMLIGFSHMKTYRDRAVKKTFQNSSLFKLTKEERLKIELKLTTLTYNLGTGGLNIPVQNALKTYSAQRPVTDANNFIQRVHEHIPALTEYTLKRPNGEEYHPFSRSRVYEMANFLSNIDNRYKKVLKDADTSSCWAAWP